MPIRRRLAAKEIHRDFRRLRSISGASGGSVAPHALLGIVHSDTAINAPVRGAMVLADSTPEWNALPHPAAAGVALTTDATDVIWDPTPTWTDDHTWDDGVTDSPAIHFITQSDDQFSFWAENHATPGNSDFVVKFPAYDADSRFIWRDSLDNDVAWVDADGNTTWDGTSHRFGVTDLGTTTVRVSGAATGSAAGGQINLELAADHDGVFESWNIDVNTDNLRFFSSDAAVLNVMTAEGGLLLPTTGGGAGLFIGGDAQWYRSEADMLSTPDNVTIETRCFGFLKAQDQHGRIGNGPVEYGEVVAVGGTMEIAPAAALWATVTIN